MDLQNEIYRLQQEIADIEQQIEDDRIEDALVSTLEDEVFRLREEDAMEIDPSVEEARLALERTCEYNALIHPNSYLMLMPTHSFSAISMTFKFRADANPTPKSGDYVFIIFYPRLGPRRNVLLSYILTVHRPELESISRHGRRRTTAFDSIYAPYRNEVLLTQSEENQITEIAREAMQRHTGYPIRDFNYAMYTLAKNELDEWILLPGRVDANSMEESEESEESEFLF